MDPKVNVKLIGAAVLFILTIVGSLFFFIHKNRYEQCSEVYYVQFDQPILGLKKGDPVVYNGINAGRVLDLQPDFKTLKGVIIRICLDSHFPIKVDAIAMVESKTITGGLVIHIYPGSVQAKELERNGQEIPVIPGKSSRMDQMLQALPKILFSLEVTMKKIELLFSSQMVSDIHRSVESLRVVTEIMKDAFQKNETTINVLLSEVPLKISQFLDRGNSTLLQLEKTLQSIDKSPRRFLYQDPTQGVKLP